MHARHVGRIAIASLAWTLAAWPVAAQEYTVTLLRGGKTSWALGLSTASPPHVAGTVVTRYERESRPCGIDDDSHGPCYDYIPVHMATLWRDGRRTSLGTLGGTNSHATAATDYGLVVGESEGADGWPRAFTWQDGVMTDLGTLGGGRSRAEGVNDFGDVVGAADLADGTSHAFLWQGAVMADLGTLDGDTESTASGINALGDVVGHSYTTATAPHAFLWQAGTMTALGTLPGGAWNGSTATDVSDAGHVVGFANEGASRNRAVLWHDGSLTDLGTLGGLDSWAYGVNSFGQVVGTSTLVGGTQTAFIWDPVAGMRNLHDLIPPDSGWHLGTPYDINDAGEIVGHGYHRGTERAYVLTPSP